MLDQLRRGVGTILAKILLGLLIIAFAVWGVADVFRGYGRGTLAKIGKTEISVEEYRQAYQDELTSISRRLGRRLTPEQAKLLGIEQRALSRLIGAAAIDTHAHELSLSISEKALADIIRSDPAFHGPDGAFSNRTFQSFLRQAGMSEARFVAERRREEVRDQLTDTLLGGIAPPQSVIDLLHRYREETRVIEYVVPDFAKLIKLAEPDDAKLKEQYEQNKARFMKPELRKINILLLTREGAKARASVTDEEVKAAYEADKEKYNIPEKRHILQLSFPDKAAAEKAYAELAKTKNFKEAATKLGFKEGDFDLGTLSRRDMIDAKLADAAFTLKKDELSKPVEGQFAIVLLRVTEITPGKQRPYDEVKAEIKDHIAGERAAQEIQVLHDKIEDERSAGRPLKEIAEQLKIPFHEIAEIDRSGKTSDGKPAIENAEAGRIAEAAFGGAAGIEAEATELGDGGYAWIDVVAVTPEKLKPFDEVKTEVKELVTELERRKEVAAFAAKLVERLGKGETLAAVAKDTGAKIERTIPVTRTTVPQGLTQNAVQQVFALPKGGSSSAVTADGKARIVLRVADVIAAPAAKPEQIERIKAEVGRQMQSDALAEYLAGLQKRYGLSVNEAALRQALGSEREPQQPGLE